MTTAMDAASVRTALEGSLPEWLPRQRWYGGPTTVTSVSCEDLVELEASPAVALAVVAVAGDERGGEVRYHVPVAADSPSGVRPSDPGAIVSETPELVVFDALADPRTAAPLWRLVAGGGARDGAAGRAVAGGGTLDAGLEDIVPLAREQSNSSLVVGGSHLLKVMRRVVFEPSVELEMTRALAAAGFDHVAQPESWLHYERDGERHGALLAIAQRYLHNGSEGWTLALTSLRDLYAEAEDRLDGGVLERLQTVEEAGGSFTAEAARLGDITAQMHLALAHASGDDIAPVSITPGMLDDWASELEAELSLLIDALRDELSELDAARAELLRRIDAVRHLQSAGLAIRVHGDLHLGQVLRTDSGWTVLDFEGEPRRSVEHRRRRHSPLRDVAGMLRSFDYAAAVALDERASRDDPLWDHLEAHGASWAAANREAFWVAYIERTSGSELLPDAGAALTLRRAFEIQKAVYEVGYERAHRPGWVRIPLAFLLEAAP